MGGKAAVVSIGRMKERLPSTKLKETEGWHLFLRFAMCLRWWPALSSGVCNSLTPQA